MVHPVTGNERSSYIIDKPPSSFADDLASNVGGHMDLPQDKSYMVIPGTVVHHQRFMVHRYCRSTNYSWAWPLSWRSTHVCNDGGLPVPQFDWRRPTSTSMNWQKVISSKYVRQQMEAFLDEVAHYRSPAFNYPTWSSCAGLDGFRSVASGMVFDDGNYWSLVCHESHRTFMGSVGSFWSAWFARLPAYLRRFAATIPVFENVGHFCVLTSVISKQL